MTESEILERPLVVLSGCSGGGKTAILVELQRRGHPTLPEPGRQIVRDQMRIGGPALPDRHPDLFAEINLSAAMGRFEHVLEKSPLTFTDRSIIDPLAFRARNGGLPPHFDRAARVFRYHRQVFLTPPWREIYANDPERTHTFEDACVEYESLVETFPAYGYEVIDIPKLSVAERVHFILETLGVL